MRIFKTVQIGKQGAFPVYEQQPVSRDEFTAALEIGFNRNQRRQVIARMDSQLLHKGVYRVRVPLVGKFTVKGRV